jgi:two-component system CheB/CheR fusion protein
LQQKLMPVFHYALRPDGFLLLGACETAGRFNESFAREDQRAKSYRKKTGAPPARVPPPKTAADAAQQFSPPDGSGHQLFSKLKNTIPASRALP